MLKDGTPMDKWITTSRYILKKHGNVRVNLWLKKFVPDQLREAVRKQL